MSDPEAAEKKGGSLLAWLELCRISNLPTVWSNVLVGYALGWLCSTPYLDPRIVAGRAPVPEIPNTHGWLLLGQTALAVSLFYIAGMALNDVVDARVDQQERPKRPIPSGRISFKAAVIFIILCFAGGIALIIPLGIMPLLFSFGLIITIAAYDLIHKKVAASVLLMGACRGWIYLIAAAAWTGWAGWTQEGWLMIAVFCIAITAYTVGITVVARSEISQTMDSRKWFAVAMPLIVLSVVLVVPRIPTADIWQGNAMIAAVALAYWLGLAVRHVFAKPPRTIKAVLTWLSGISLVDAYFLCVLGQPPMIALAAGLCFALTHAGHRKIMGT